MLSWCSGAISQKPRDTTWRNRAERGTREHMGTELVSRDLDMGRECPRQSATEERQSNPLPPPLNHQPSGAPTHLFGF